MLKILKSTAFFYILLIMLMSATAWVSCGVSTSTPSPKSEIWFRSNVSRFMKITNQIDTAAAHYADVDYLIPTKKSVAAGLKEYEKFIFDFRKKYDFSTVDCDNYSLVCSSFMQFYLSKHNKTQNVGTTFGEFYYYLNATDGHAINVVICKNELSQIELLFVEPNPDQGGPKLLTLTDLEKKSCMFWKFN